MCKKGDTTLLELRMAAVATGTCKKPWVMEEIDRCIANLVEVLQAGGIDMLNSCCGHDEELGFIMLDDGRTLLVADSRTAIYLRKKWAEREALVSEAVKCVIAVTRPSLT